MVTIRLARDSLIDRYGLESVDLLKKYAEIIGYSVEVEDEISIELNPDRLDLASFPTLMKSARNFYELERIRARITFSENEIITLEKDALKIRPYVVTFSAKGNRIGGNLDFLIQYQEKLHETVGKGRSRSSIGIHDLDKVVPPFSYTSRKMDYVFTTFDGYEGTIQNILEKHPKGIEYSGLINHSERAPIIIDSSGRVLSMPPVINGVTSKLDEFTSNFFVDVTGTDLRAVSGTAYLMINMFSSLGYSITINLVNAQWFRDFKTFNDREIYLSNKEIQGYTDIVSNDIEKWLHLMGYGTKNGDKEEIIASVPGYRIDVMGAADIIEDIAKAAGYDNIKEKPLTIGTLGTGDPLRDATAELKSICASMGFQEVMNFFVTSSEVYNKERDKSGLQIINPKSEENSVVRSSLYPSMLWAFRLNKHRATPQKIFEIGSVVERGEQSLRLCLAEYGSKSSFNECRKTMDSLFSRTIGKLPVLRESASSDLIRGRGGTIEMGKQYLGIMGEISPEALIEFELSLPVTMIEIDLSRMLDIINQGS